MAKGPDILNWPRGPDAMDCASARWSAVRVLSLSLGRRGDCMSAMDVSSCKNGRPAPSLVIVLSLSRRWGEAIMNEARAARYRRFFALTFAGLFLAGFGAARLVAVARRGGIKPAFSTCRTQ